MPRKYKKNPGVYIWRNKVNGKAYVGSGAVSAEQRRDNHRDALRKGTHNNSYFQRAWNKYGEKAFEWSVLERCAPDKCLEREQHWLDTLETWKRDKGYNICRYAGNTLGVKQTWPVSDAQREARKKNALVAVAKRDPEQAKEHARKAGLKGAAKSGEALKQLAKEGKHPMQLLTEEQAAERASKISTSCKGLPKSEEWKAAQKANPNYKMNRRVVGHRRNYAVLYKNSYPDFLSYLRDKAPRDVFDYFLMRQGLPPEPEPMIIQKCLFDWMDEDVCNPEG